MSAEFRYSAFNLKSSYIADDMQIGAEEKK